LKGFDDQLNSSPERVRTEVRETEATNGREQIVMPPLFLGTSWRLRANS